MGSAGPTGTYVSGVRKLDVPLASGSFELAAGSKTTVRMFYQTFTFPPTASFPFFDYYVVYSSTRPKNALVQPRTIFHDEYICINTCISVQLDLVRNLHPRAELVRKSPPL